MTLRGSVRQHVELYNGKVFYINCLIDLLHI